MNRFSYKLFVDSQEAESVIYTHELPQKGQRIIMPFNHELNELEVRQVIHRVGRGGEGDRPALMASYEIYTRTIK